MLLEKKATIKGILIHIINIWYIVWFRFYLFYIIHLFLFHLYELYIFDFCFCHFHFLAFGFCVCVCVRGCEFGMFSLFPRRDTIDDRMCLFLLSCVFATIFAELYDILGCSFTFVILDCRDFQTFFMWVYQ